MSNKATTFTGRALAAGVLALGIGCGGGGYGGGDVVDSDYVMYGGVAEGTTVFTGTDVRCPLPLSTNFNVTVDFAAVPGGAGPTEPPTINDVFQLSHYVVTYRNLRNGGTTPGVDVPRPFQQVSPFEPEPVPVTFNLTGFNENSPGSGWPILLAAAKGEPPLNNLQNFPPGGIDFEARITFWGHPVNEPGDEISATARFVFTVFDSGVNNAEGCR